MRFLLSFLIIALLGYIAGEYLPWWSIAICCFVISAAIRQSPARSFSAGFIALLLLWGGLSLWISSQNDHILAKKMSAIIFKSPNEWILVLVTALIGALVAGFSAWSASFIWPRIRRTNIHSRSWFNETIFSVPVHCRLYKIIRAKGFWNCVYREGRPPPIFFNNS